MGYPNLLKRDRCYYFRQKVPVDLRTHYGKNEIKFSIGALSFRDAKTRVSEERVAYQRQFEIVRAAGLQETPRDRAQELGLLHAAEAFSVEQVGAVDRARLPRVVVLNAVDERFIDRVCATYLRESLLSDLDAPSSVVPGDRLVHTYLSSTVKRFDPDELRRAVRARDVGVVAGALTSYLARLGYRVDAEAPGYKQLAFTFLETVLREAIALESRDAGRPVAPEITALASIDRTVLVPHGKPGLTFDKMTETWSLARTQTRKTVDEVKSVVASFQEYLREQHQVVEVEHVTRQHATEYRDHLLGAGLKWNTVNKKLAFIRKLFTKAVRDEKLASNPFDQVAVDKPKKGRKARFSYSVAELNAIVRSDIYLTGKRPAGCGQGAAFWVPLIAIFTGMRVEEICQLRVADVGHHPRGMFFRVTDEGPGQKLKTEPSRRLIPVHDELLKIGFAEFVQDARTRRDGWLFADLDADKYGNRSARFSKVWNPLTKKLLGRESRDRSRTLHSTRHAWKDHARACKIAEEVHDALSGHGKTGEARKYGSGEFPEDPLFDAVQQFRINGLDVSHLYLSSRAATQACSTGR
jgi:integrase